MKFSAQEEYGLRCLLQIARSTGQSLTIPEISRREQLTQTHVAKILMALRRGGFLASTRGQSGGYTLARPADQILVADVLSEMGGKLYDDGFCSRHGGLENELCTHAINCSVRSLWQRVQAAVDASLANLTIADMVAEDVTVPVPNVTFFDHRPSEPSLR